MEEEGKVATATPEKLDLDEATVGDGFRGELVSVADIKQVLEMTKDEVNDYTVTRFGVTLNLSEKIKMIRLKAVNMIREKLKAEQGGNSNEKATTDDGVAETTKNPEFIFNPANRRIFEWTPILAARKDLKPCYVVGMDGKRL